MPFFSIIIPVHNGAAHLPACLRSVQSSSFTDWELIVVDDGSSDDSARIAAEFGAQVVGLNGRSGPAAARNLGAKWASGRYLFFTDSDCQLHTDTLSRAAQILQAAPTLDALIGSYDDEPLARNFLSQYKNLHHHYIHQTSHPTAQTFWTGCGAIKRERFLALGGFDAQRYPLPTIEDIEFGYRLVKDNGRIHLAKDVQVKHLKTWHLATLLRSDISQRAIPWARLLQQQATTPADLNLQARHRWSVAVLFMAVVSAVCAWRWRGQEMISLFLTLILIFLNKDFYRFLQRKRGWLFLLSAIPWHWLYYSYSAAAYLFAYWPRGTTQE